jgi:hypothetical protein
MGVLCDLVIANPGAAEAIGTTQRLFDDFRVFPTKLLDPVTLSGLFSLLDPAAPDRESWWEIPLYEEEELWVYQLPAHFVEKLAHLLESERNTLVRQWAQTDEMVLFYDRTSPSDREAAVRQLVDEMCLFVFEATEKGQLVFLRVTP